MKNNQLIDLKEKIENCLDFIQERCDEAVCFLDSDEKPSASYQLGKIYSTCQAFLDEHFEESEIDDEH